MAYLKRHLIFSLCMVGSVLIGATRIFAQGLPPEIPRFRALGLGEQLPELFYELRGKSVPVSTGNTTLSSFQECPSDGKISFYREVPTVEPGKPPQRIPVADLTLGESTSHMIFFLCEADPANPALPQVHAMAVDDSLSKHPAGNVRVFNFSRRKTAVRIGIGSSIEQLAPAQSRLFPYPSSGNRLWFKVATLTDAKWTVRAGSAIAVIPGTRALLVITDTSPSSDFPEPVGVNIRNIIDTSPPRESQTVTKL